MEEEEEGYDWDRNEDEANGDEDGESSISGNDNDTEYNEESMSSYMRRSPFPLVLITRKSTTDINTNSDSMFSSLPKEKTEAECIQRLSQVSNIFI